MKLKAYALPIVVMLIGFLMTTIGSLFKIMHWPNGSELLTLGMVLESIGVIILIIKLVINHKKEVNS
ncbi:hypothetical protein RM697_12360 [Ichthyenterobacterium sp. W332]|uniref:Gliding motility protein GldL-like N-terminal domain-containing protein n=1 Tax=Microcosmobacter mediterraneus TaxID=3075607 RepID=A0ABU2YMR5_9FLAO|nr:hypothetical protein [Ichthyenterobacterium sp. W332]MDT0559449.1 hypothetical protein [Ichthyenterobacterium sp. W332]